MSKLGNIALGFILGVTSTVSVLAIGNTANASSSKPNSVPEEAPTDKDADENSDNAENEQADTTETDNDKSSSAESEDQN